MTPFLASDRFARLRVSPSRLAVIVPLATLLVLLCGIGWSDASLASARQKHNGEAPSVHPAHYSELAKAPDKARTMTNPLENDPDVLAAGAKLYRLRCGDCHGDAGAGSHEGPRLNVSEIRDATPGALFWLLTNGVVRRGMPVWSKLPDQQRWQIVHLPENSGRPASRQHRRSPIKHAALRNAHAKRRILLIALFERSADGKAARNL